MTCYEARNWSGIGPLNITRDNRVQAIKHFWLCPECRDWLKWAAEQCQAANEKVEIKEVA